SRARHEVLWRSVVMPCAGDRPSYRPKAVGCALERVVAFGEAEAEDRPGIDAVQEGRRRNGRDTMLLQEPHRDLGIAVGGNRRVIHHLKERSAARQRTEARLLDEVEEQIPLALVERAH